MKTTQIGDIFKQHSAIIGKVLGFVLISLLGIVISHYKAAAPEPISTPAPRPSIPAPTVTESRKLTVYISGAVTRSGVYSLAYGARLYDLIAEAGDFLDTAKTTGLNLARPLKDGEHIHIPHLNVAPKAITRSSSSSSRANHVLISINRANAKDLKQLPGIGPTLAKRIISYRTKAGGFSSLDELKQVKGIGSSQFQKLQNHIQL